MTPEDIQWPDLAPGATPVMHHGTLLGRPFEELARIAALSGCSALTLPPNMARDLAKGASGRSGKDAISIAADYGIALTHLDPIMCWLPRWQPDPTNGALPLDIYDVPLDDVFRATDALGIGSISILGAFPPGSNSITEIMDNFGRLCERAARHAVRCDIEFVPFWGIADLATAWHILQQVNAPNTGIMFDFWHYCRGKRDDDLLRSIPGERIAGVQFDDGWMTKPAERNIYEDTGAFRAPPGQGEMPIREVTAILREMNALKNIGPEILSAEIYAMSGEEVARTCRESMTWALS
ncbi:MAG: sugar phosphate isomerase/epimerase [Sphingobium sp.]|jgi:sugar phosphate isomerase/epimerase|nr:sugar phosphate isomerase/epimerase [Sphingobium sp.]MCI1270769.1 sugar phosphate isomerase/epimerase [Sphingobium sp.]MCI1756381.1 sugar phosphate isomerase/epimerase [Sphingobium sp.]MCI2051924.1 sugar phosphate isomerase/epimerase [Sphingobium sp.]